jgi:hypothetical protein
MMVAANAGAVETRAMASANAAYTRGNSLPLIGSTACAALLHLTFSFREKEAAAIGVASATGTGRELRGSKRSVNYGGKNFNRRMYGRCDAAFTAGERRKKTNGLSPRERAKAVLMPVGAPSNAPPRHCGQYAEPKLTDR